jgi:hypothetical protein
LANTDKHKAVTGGLSANGRFVRTADAGDITRYVASWHEADVQRLPGSGPLTGALPTFGAECRFIGAFQT